MTPPVSPLPPMPPAAREPPAAGGQVGVAGHLKIGNNIKVAATSAIYKDVPDGCDVGGTPALPLSEARRLVMSQLKLPDALAELKRLKKQVEKLEKQLNQP